MRLNPKYVFFGIVVFGLPFAVTAGWLLGTPATNPPVASAPGGAGGIGSAPEQVATSEPGTAVQYSSQPPRPGAAQSSPPTAPASTAPLITTAPAPATPTSTTASAGTPPPVLDMPPVPTPTEIFNPPPSPSATPSANVPTGEPQPTGVAGGQ